MMYFGLIGWGRCRGSVCGTVQLVQGIVRFSRPYQRRSEQDHDLKVSVIRLCRQIDQIPTLSTLSLRGHLPVASRRRNTPYNVTGQELQIRNTDRNGPFVAVTFPLAYLDPLNALFQCTSAFFNTPNIAYTLRSIQLPPCLTTPCPFSLSVNP